MSVERLKTILHREMRNLLRSLPIRIICLGSCPRLSLEEGKDRDKNRDLPWKCHLSSGGMQLVKSFIREAAWPFSLALRESVAAKSRSGRPPSPAQETESPLGP